MAINFDDFMESSNPQPSPSSESLTLGSFTENISVFGSDESTSEEPISNLYPYPDNPMSMDKDENWNALKESIEKYGLLKDAPIIVEKQDDGTCIILSGHRRAAIAKELGIEKAPVVYRSFDTEEERKRFVDICNNSRATKIKDILKRYKYNEELYNKGYFNDRPYYQNGKGECLATVIGFPYSKIKNLTFMIPFLGTENEVLLDLVDEGVIPVSTLSNLQQQSNKKKLKNYDEVLAALVSDEILQDKEKEVKDRKKHAKELIECVSDTGKPRKKLPKAHKEYEKLFKQYQKVSASELDFNIKEKDKQLAVGIITQLIDELKKDLKQFK